MLVGGSALGLIAAGVVQAVSTAPAAGLAGAVVPATGPPVADDLVDIRRQQSAARGVAARLAQARAQAGAELTESSAALQSTTRRLTGVEAQLETVRGQERVAATELTAARAREAALRASVARTTQETAAAQAALSSTTAELARAERAVGALARAAYRAGAVPALAEVVTAGPAGVLSSAQALGSATRSQQSAAARLAALRTEQAARQSRLRALGAHLAADRDAAAETLARVAALRDQAAARTARTSALVESRRRAADAALAARDADLAERAGLDAEQARTGALLRSLSGRADAEVVRARAVRAAARARAAARSRAAEQARRGELARRAELARRTDRVEPAPVAPMSTAPASAQDAGTGRLSRPADGPITSPFGRRYHPILHVWRLHAGTDFGCGCGSPIRAAAAGRVVSSAFSGGFGNRVLVDHGEVDGIPLASSYNHLTRSVVRTGARVSRGQLVGLSGQTGLATGCHLHFEVYENGTPVDPMTWLT